MDNLIKKEILEKLHIKHYEKGEVLFEEGDLPDETMFFLFKGELGIYKEMQEGKRDEIRRIYPGEFFGEIGLLNKQPRIATIIAISDDNKVGLFDRESLNILSYNSPEFLFNMFRETIGKLSRANLKYSKIYTSDMQLPDEIEKSIEEKFSMKNYNIRDYVNDVATKNYLKGDVVFLQGDISDGAMYFIFEGEFSVSYRDENGKEQEMARLKRGDFFGEMALLNDNPRSATIKPTSFQSKVAKIDRGVFMKVSRINPDFLIMILKVMFARLSKTEEKIAYLLDNYS